MKRATLRKVWVVLALVALAPLGLASVTGSTVAYLVASESVTNSFTFEQRQLGRDRTDRVNYYYLNKNGTATQIQDSGYTNNTWTYQANQRVFISDANTNIKAAPNGFRLSYATVGGNRVNAGGSFVQPNQNNTAVNIYFEPITYSIAYDFNGYNESDITFSDTPLQSTYTVFDMIMVPYEADSVQPYTGFQRIIYCTLGGLFGGGNSIQCNDDVPTAEVNGNTLLGWEDQNNTLHTYSNASGSWASDIGTVSNNGVYNAFAARQSGNLTLTARWQYQPSRSGVDNMNSRKVEVLEAPVEEDQQELEIEPKSEDDEAQELVVEYIDNENDSEDSEEPQDDAEDATE